MNLKIVSFELGKELYGINVQEIGEILRVPVIAAVPNTPDYIQGVINLRGNIVPVINLNSKFDFESKKLENKEEKIIVIEDRDEYVGILVDNVNEVIKIKEEDIAETPDIETSLPKDVFLGVLNFKKRMLILLEIRKVLNIKEEA